MNPLLRRPISGASAFPILYLLLAGSALEGPRPSTAIELRCQCVRRSSQMVPPRQIVSVAYYNPGPHCQVAEVIVTMKNGLELCLNPSAPWVKRMVMKMMERSYEEMFRNMTEDAGKATDETKL